MNAFNADARAFWGPFSTSPYPNSHLHSCWITRQDVFGNSTGIHYEMHRTHSPYIPLNPGSRASHHDYHQRGTCYCYLPQYLCPQNQQLHPQWHSYRHVKSEEVLRPQPGQAFREFQWRCPDFDGTFGLERDTSPSPRPVSPLSHVGDSIRDDVLGDSVEGYQSGCAEVKLDLDKEDGTEVDTRTDTSHVRYSANEHPTSMKGTTGEASTSTPNPHVHFRNTTTNTPHQTADSRFTARWQDLLSRESQLAVRENIFKEDQKSLATKGEQLKRDRRELDIKEHHFHRLRFELQVEQRRFQEERMQWDTWFQHDPCCRPQHDMWMGSESVDYDMEATDDEAYRWGECLSVEDIDSRHERDNVWGAREQADRRIDVKKAFAEYDTHWDHLQQLIRTTSLQNTEIRFPTVSGKPENLLDCIPKYVPHIQTHNLPYVYNSLSQDDRIKFNVFGFFLDAFSILIVYIPSPSFVFQSNINSTPGSRLNLRAVNKDAVKKLRDHLLRKEFNRWHPDKLNRFLEGDGKVVVSKDQRLQMTTRSIAMVVDQVVRSLRNECEEALRKVFGT